MNLKVTFVFDLFSRLTLNQVYELQQNGYVHPTFPIHTEYNGLCSKSKLSSYHITGFKYTVDFNPVMDLNEEGIKIFLDLYGTTKRTDFEIVVKLDGFDLSKVVLFKSAHMDLYNKANQILKDKDIPYTITPANVSEYLDFRHPAYQKLTVEEMFNMPFDWPMDIGRPITSKLDTLVFIDNNTVNLDHIMVYPTYEVNFDRLIDMWARNKFKSSFTYED